MSEKLQVTSGRITAYAGVKATVCAGGTATGAATGSWLSYPTAITIDKYDNLYIADWGNNIIRKVTSRFRLYNGR
jgi:hypothetical protein